MKINKKSPNIVVGISDQAQEKIREEAKKAGKYIYEYVNDLVLNNDEKHVLSHLDLLINKIETLTHYLQKPKRGWFTR